MNSNTSLSLLSRLSQQPQESDWRRLFDIYSPLMRQWMAGYGIAETDAADISQDVFQTLLREIPTFEHNGHAGAFRRWLRTIMVHRIKWMWRSRKRETQVAETGRDTILASMEDPNSDPNRIWDAEHDVFVAQRLLRLVEPRFTLSSWEAFRMQVMEGEKALPVAEKLGMTVNAVLVAKSRVLKALRDEATGLIDLDWR